MTKKFYNKFSFLPDIIFPALLIIYALLLVNQGINLSDVGYNYGNFYYFDRLDPMWKFSTFIPNFIGFLFTHLPGGDTLLGLNIYTSFVKAAIPIMVYFCCVKCFSMKRPVVFLAELMALGYCWCPTGVFYNYCTYLFFTAGGMLLALAVKYEKKYLYLLAGACLGMNVFVRLPNVVECLLILSLWVYCILEKIKFKDALIRTLLCIGGYFLGMLVIFIPISIVYGPAEYIDSIIEMLSITDEAQGYSIKQMIRGDLLSFYMNFKWVLLALIPALLGTLIYLIPGKNRFVMCIKRIVVCAICLAIIMLFRKLHMFGFIFYAYDSIYYVGIFFLIIAGLMGLYVTFFTKKDPSLRMLAMIMGLIILISPLGSNNYLFSSENNLFLVTPFVFHCIYLLFRDFPKAIGKKKRISLEPLKLTITIMTLFALFQGVMFGANFVFQDGIMGEKRTAVIEENDTLKYMHTTKENGELIRSVNDYINANNLSGSDAIFYGDVPGLAFYMKLNPVLTSTWPDLASFSSAKFIKEMDAVNNALSESGNKPLVILGYPIDYSTPKTDQLNAFLAENGYEENFRSGRITIYR